MKRLLLFVVGVFFLFSCAQKEELIVLKSIKSYKLKEKKYDSFLFHKGKIYFGNSLKGHIDIYKFDNGIKFEKSFLRKGKAPGEVGGTPVGPASFTFNFDKKGRLIILDSFLRRLLIFSDSGEYVDTMDMPFIGRTFQGYDDNKILVNILPLMQDKIFGIYDLDKNKIDYLNISVKKSKNVQNNIFKSMAFFDRIRDKLYIGYIFSSKIEYYSFKEKKIVKSISLVGESKDSGKIDVKKLKPMVSCVKCYNGKVYFLHIKTEINLKKALKNGGEVKHKKYDSYLYEYDEQLNYIKRYKFDADVTNFAFINGRLYCLAENKFIDYGEWK